MSSLPDTLSTTRTDARPPRGVLQLLKAYFTTNRIGDLLVLKGRLSPVQLEHALVLSRARGQRLGRILVDERILRPHELYALLGTQWSVRTLAWGVAMLMSVGVTTPRTARADDDRVQQYSMTETYAYNSAARVPSSTLMPRFDFAFRTIHAPLFGSDERRSDDLSAFVKWTSMFERYNAQLEMNSTRATLVAWKNQITMTAPDTVADLARGIDHIINQIDYVDDRENWGRSDYWATPFEFLSRGGDCEDFAIAKYMSLKALGVPEDQLRIAIVHDLVRNQPHAILIVYSNEGPLVLDNQSQVTHHADEITRYKPIFSINAKSWWLHTGGARVEVASAAR